MNNKIKVGAVSYLNTKPLLYGIERSPIAKDIELVLNYPALLAQQLHEGQIDMALLPVAAMPQLPGSHIVSDYGIATDGHVVSVAIFSNVPMEQVRVVYLDYQSRTSVQLAKLLLAGYWRQEVTFRHAPENYLELIEGETAGVVIGDRALEHLNRFAYSYDLSAAWKAHTGLDFVFAAWVARQPLPTQFIADFNAANAEGLLHLDEVIAQNPYPHYDLHTYYTKNIKFLLDEHKLMGLRHFHQLMQAP